MSWETRSKKDAKPIEDFIRTFVSSSYADVSLYDSPPPRSHATEPSGASPAARAVHKLLAFLQWSHADLAYWSGIAQPQLSQWLRGGIARLGPDELARISWSIAGGLDGVLLSRSQGRQSKDAEDIPNIDPLSRPAASKSPLYRRPACSRLDLIQSVLLRLAGYSGATEYRDMIWRSCFQSGAPRPLRIGYFPWPPLLNAENEGVVRDITASVCALFELKDTKYRKVEFYRCEDAIRSHYIDIVSPLMMIIPGRLPWLEFSDPIPHIWVRLCGVIAQGQKVELRNNGKFKTLIPDNTKVEVEAPPREAVTLAVRNTPLIRVKAAEYSKDDANEFGGHSAYLLKGLRSKPKSDDGRVRVVLTNSVSAEQACSGDTGLMRVEIAEISSLRFPLGFALSPEEPRLRRAINRAIGAMKDTGQFDRLLKDKTLKGVDIE